MALVDAALVFVASLLVGAIAILAGARLIVDRDAGPTNAVLTALIGAAIWAASSAALEWVQVLEWIPIVGGVLMLVVWIGVINWRYPGGWGEAIAVGFVAWIVAVAVVYVLVSVGYVTPEALGVPGI